MSVITDQGVWRDTLAMAERFGSATIAIAVGSYGDGEDGTHPIAAISGGAAPGGHRLSVIADREVRTTIAAGTADAGHSQREMMVFYRPPEVCASAIRRLGGRLVVHRSRLGANAARESRRECSDAYPAHAAPKCLFAHRVPHDCQSDPVKHLHDQG